MRFFCRNTNLPINIFSLVLLFNLHVRPTELTNSMNIFIYYIYPIMTIEPIFYTEYCLQIMLNLINQMELQMITEVKKRLFVAHL